MQRIFTECLLYVLEMVLGTKNIRMVVKTIILPTYLKSDKDPEIC